MSPSMNPGIKPGYVPPEPGWKQSFRDVLPKD